MYLPSEIAPICHETIRQYQMLINNPNNPVSPPWDECAEEMRSSLVDAVDQVIFGVTTEQLHRMWMSRKLEDGWVFGEVKDFEKKTHPCLVPYCKLSEEEKRKDYLIISVVMALTEEIQ